TVGLAPDHLVRRRPEQRSDRQRQPARAQKAHHATCALQLPELGEDEVQARLHFFVRVENDGTCPVIDKPGGQREVEFAARRFLPLALMKAHPDLVMSLSRTSTMTGCIGRSTGCCRTSVRSRSISKVAWGSCSRSTTSCCSTT